MSDTSTPAGYTFGPLERRGLLLGLSAVQVAAALVAAIVAIVLLVRGAVGPAVLWALVAVPVTVGRISGRPLMGWLPVVGRFGRRRSTGRGRHRARRAQQGMTTGADPTGTSVGPQLPPPVLPEGLEDLELLGVALDGQEVAVVRDGRGRQAQYVVILRGQPDSWSLLDVAEQDRRIAGWGDALATLARQGSPVTRVQWTERTVPDEGEAHAAYMAEAMVDMTASTLPAAVIDSYLGLNAHGAAPARAHDLLLAVRIDPRRARNRWKQLGGDEPAACELAVDVATEWAAELARAGVTIIGALSPRAAAAVIRLAYDPEARTAAAVAAAHGPEAAGVAVEGAWPTAADDGWDSYRTDSAWHRTLWIEEWPRLAVDARWLGQLLLRSPEERAVSMVMEPVPEHKAVRAAEMARVADATDEEIRQRRGFLPTARRKAQAANVVRREEELAAGHAEMRFSGYVTISASSAEGLEEAATSVINRAARARLRLAPCWGEQAEAFSYTLPLGRGLD
ncbi:hypothetical protein HC251_25250 (plasmid) [Iamia sp. SCSIO 61187]|uniref:SCO6880 family protein n=1 Tax=Iamia sp. SCSIO 61187 TaxID=2722752 RepID=UPI001C628602|nr:SCO6880 family protein [Iamia sp. SCSIO 61187]QYG95858.1 hypothetical protein HC251_25250 [Iamia sp. SCSIO 61187]